MKAVVIVTDKPTANGRIYPRAVMEKAIADYERKHVPVYRSLADFEAVQCEQMTREVIGTGTLTMSGTNVYAQVAFKHPSIEQQVLLNGLSIRTGGVGSSDPIWIGEGTNRQPTGTFAVKEFELTGLFFTADPA